LVVISDEIRWMIDSFIDKTPKPIKILLFLLMLVALVSMIPFMLHIFGFHCNTDAEVIKTSPRKFTTNIQLAFIGADEYINTSSYIPDRVSSNLILGIPIESCRKPVCIVNGSYYWQSDSYCQGETIVYPLLFTQAEWSRCSICEGDVNHTAIEDSNFLGTDYYYLCLGDAQHLNQSDRNWYQDWICDEGDDCTVPKHYKWEYDTGTFDCIDPDICGLNNTEIVSKVDDLLLEADGELLYPDTTSKNYKSVIKVKCDRNYNPELTFFGIPLFDYRIWLMLIVIYILFMFLTYIKKH